MSLAPGPLATCGGGSTLEAGEYRRIAVKIVDDRGSESLKVVEVG